MREAGTNRVGRRLLSLAICAATLSAYALAQSGPAPAGLVSEQLTALLAKLPTKTQVGLVVADAADGECWFAHQPCTPLKPASVMKLLVTAAALERFGPGFCYRTSAYRQDDELWVIGAGDPALGDERIARRDGRPLLFPFDQWVSALKARGVVTLESIVLDDGVFDRQRRHPDWPDDQADRWYQAPVGGLNFNDNCLDARLKPEDGVVKLVLRPPLPSTFYVSSLRAGKQHRPTVKRNADRDVFEFSGTVARESELRPVSVRRPTLFFGHALKQALAGEGIEVRGEVVRRTIPAAVCAEATLLGQHATPLSDILWRCNTFSQNLFAECLLKSLPAYGPDGRRSGRTGSWEAGTRLLREVVTELGVDLSGAVLCDGSGLSHHNRLSADQVTRLLVRMHHHRCAAAFRESLAVPGREGSMRRRYADAALRDRLRGKTGTLNGVRTLAGYVRRADGTTLAFALLCNGQCDPDLPTRAARILATAGAGE